MKLYSIIFITNKRKSPYLLGSTMCGYVGFCPWTHTGLLMSNSIAANAFNVATRETQEGDVGRLHDLIAFILP